MWLQGRRGRMADLMLFRGPTVRKLLVAFLIAGALALGLLVPHGSSAPALVDKPARYEYAELRYYQQSVPGAPAVTMYCWCTADEEIVAPGWNRLADALKAPASKKGGNYTDRLRVFNAIGRDGWEEVEHRREGNVWAAFRRRVP
jgi:hypothetical protein